MINPPTTNQQMPSIPSVAMEMGRRASLCLTLLALVALAFPASPATAQPPVNPALRRLNKNNKGNTKPNSGTRSGGKGSGGRSAPQVIVKEKIVYVKPTPKPKPTPDPNRPPLEPKPGMVWKNPKDGAPLVFIPSGPFIMGSSPTDPEAEDFEKPQRRVNLSGFWMYRDLVTVAQYEKFCKATGRLMPAAPDFNPDWGKKDHPIVNVTWDDARDYCTWAGAMLPTEAQWEKAARGDAAFKYPWGETFDTNKLFCSLEAGDARGTAPVDRASRISVSPYGIRDMAGNVWQWCADLFDPEYYKTGSVDDPTGPAVAAGNSRIYRGGSWYNNNPANFRATNRQSGNPLKSRDVIGFRAVMPMSTLPGEQSTRAPRKQSGKKSG